LLLMLIVRDGLPKEESTEEPAEIFKSLSNVTFVPLAVKLFLSPLSLFTIALTFGIDILFLVLVGASSGVGFGDAVGNIGVEGAKVGVVGALVGVVGTKPDVMGVKAEEAVEVVEDEEMPEDVVEMERGWGGVLPNLELSLPLFLSLLIVTPILVVPPLPLAKLESKMIGL
jgi:hypothetical protein